MNKNTTHQNQTGALLSYVLSPQWTFDAGVTRGWNQSIDDSNGSEDFLGRVTFTPTDKTTFIFVMTEGPEFPAVVGRGLPKGDDSHWWTVLTGMRPLELDLDQWLLAVLRDSNVIESETSYEVSPKYLCVI